MMIMVMNTAPVHAYHALPIPTQKSSTTLFPNYNCSSRKKSSPPRISAASVSLQTGVERTTAIHSSDLEIKERIRKLFHDVDISLSSYDTAWVAMVPAPHSSQSPLFPQCINWLLDNQLPDGSWSLPPHHHHHHPLLLKDALSSTLACVLALRRWGIGQEQVDKGIRFVELNFASASDQNQHLPVGFDIIFPGMLEYARDLNLNLQLESATVDALLLKRDQELIRFFKSYSDESKAYLAYVSEGIIKLQNWDTVMKFQRKNGSLFNSPSATAAAVMHVHNPGCLDYLHSVLEKHGNAVPTVYPLDIYPRLCLVDNLERLGICGHFRKEILSVLDDTYRCWMQGDEEIFAEKSTCAIAFTLLRKHGYNISADPLTPFLKEECFSNSLGGCLKDTSAVLELYRALEMIISQNESALVKKSLWSRSFLKEHISGGCDLKGFSNQISKQVDDILNFPSHATLQRVANRRSIEQYNLDSTKILKTSYCSSNFSNKDLLILAVKDFNHCQLIHREELKELERWVADNRLDKLKFARQKSAYCYFSAAATIFSPELSDARISWAKNGVLTTLVDDFFDVGGSLEELKKLIELVEKWDINVSDGCCSEPVQILFSALHSTIQEIGDKAFKWQARSVTNHIIKIWLDLLNSMLREAEWARNATVPTVEEYMTNGYVSFALGPIILPALYLVGPKLSEELVKDSEFHSLFKLVSTCGRLLNDVHSFERESKAGQLNALSLRLIHGGVGITEAAAVAEMKSSIEKQRRELLRLVLRKEGSVVPRACKDLFWNMSRVLHQFYVKDDGFTSEEMIELVKSIIYEPIAVNEF
uniref:Terpene synthase 4 n=1 Tax=Chiococca alba TaxID=28527 RepID=A0A6M3EVX3_CHIAL|nr:terpene synthase 4 [Chiococca alba]